MTKDVKISWFLEQHNPQMYVALRDRARKAEAALRESKEGSASLIALNAQLESRSAGLLQDLDNAQVRISRFEGLLQSTVGGTVTCARRRGYIGEQMRAYTRW